MDKQKSKHAILGINVSHNASAALMVENEIVACFQEERLTNKKSFFGYPKKSIDCCLNYAKDLNTVIFPSGVDSFFGNETGLSFFISLILSVLIFFS